MGKDAYYFSHDANARHDPKILAMMSVYGAKGYGWYWIIIEMLREQSDLKLSLSGKYTFNAIAMQMHCNADECKKFVLDCINEFELFASDDHYFWSESLIRRMEKREEVSKKRSEAAKKRWSKKPDTSKDSEQINTTSEQKESKTDANALQSGSIKGKEKKVKERKEKEIKTKEEEPGPENMIDFLIQNNIVHPGSITPTLRDDLADVETNFNFDDPLLMIKEAVKDAVRGNGRTWKFVYNKLNIWRKQGIKTVDQLRFLEEKQSMPRQSFNKPKQEPQPKWLDDENYGKDNDDPAALEEAKRKSAEMKEKLKQKRGVG